MHVNHFVIVSDAEMSKNDIKVRAVLLKLPPEMLEKVYFISIYFT